MKLERARHLLTAVAALALVLTGSSAATAQSTDTSTLRAAVKLAAVRAHQKALQEIADANGGIRASGTPGFDASVDYVVEQLTDAGYRPLVQTFAFPFYQELRPPTLDQTAPVPITYEPNADFFTMTYSGAGDVTARTVRPDSFGCDAGDFDRANFSGRIALILRGGCSFVLKATNAEAAGAAGVIVYNDEERQDPFIGTLGGPDVAVPVVATSFTIGEDLAGATVRLATATEFDQREAANVIAETTAGRRDRVVVVGAHLDSVTKGPGIQDNGSGAAAILEIAIQMAALGIEPRNRVRFAWWGAEEFGLLGSQHYVDDLNERQRKRIALNLNFDMIGSPNFVRFVYDGDGSATGTAGPVGSKRIERVFTNFFARRGLATESTPFDGRSDYGPFIAVGIPAGGLFTGAEGIKTSAERAVYGGTAGEAYDPCYHLPCDTFDNISRGILIQMSRAAAHVTLFFARARSPVKGTATAAMARQVAAPAPEYRGSFPVR